MTRFNGIGILMVVCLIVLMPAMAMAQDSDDWGWRGATGPQGATGPMGPTGAQGPKGDVGPKGATGANGAQGPTGAKGEDGAKGLEGDRGEKGDKGSTGPQGIIGLTGATGNTGSVGPTGAQGLTGATGMQGVTGSNGIQGIPGLKGDMGYAGVSHVSMEVIDKRAIDPNNPLVVRTRLDGGKWLVSGYLDLSDGPTASFTCAVKVEETGVEVDSIVVGSGRVPLLGVIDIPIQGTVGLHCVSSTSMGMVSGKVAFIQVSNIDPLTTIY